MIAVVGRCGRTGGGGSGANGRRILVLLLLLLIVMIAVAVVAAVVVVVVVDQNAGNRVRIRMGICGGAGQRRRSRVIAVV